MSRKYNFHNKEGLYFVSFAVVYWNDVLTREEYFAIQPAVVDAKTSQHAQLLRASGSIDFCYITSDARGTFGHREVFGPTDFGEAPAILAAAQKTHRAVKRCL
ncbi:hypothetical protein [Pontibacter cellulosilyticus]|uniref:hypothetical protein n=1 Tax=Pontibacter cellulosilyticus TaxID=1720253 RepID=UPI001C9A6CC8|nr:hypothetical protein [Pontibacter cellulosilyticus]